jgi:hypothetical protein
MYEIHFKQLSASVASLGCSETQAKYLVQITLALSIDLFYEKKFQHWLSVENYSSAVDVVIFLY